MLGRFASRRWALIILLSASIAILLSLIAFRSESTMAAEDERLIMRIREAIASNIAIENVGHFVGIRPIFNSSEEGKLMRLEKLRLVLQNEKGGISDVRSAKNVVFWVRPIRFNNSKFVGIVWDNQDGMSLFYGECLQGR